MDIAKRTKQFYCAGNKIKFEIWSCGLKKKIMRASFCRVLIDHLSFSFHEKIRGYRILHY